MAVSLRLPVSGATACVRAQRHGSGSGHGGHHPSEAFQTGRAGGRVHATPPSAVEPSQPFADTLCPSLDAPANAAGITPHPHRDSRPPLERRSRAELARDTRKTIVATLSHQPNRSHDAIIASVPPLGYILRGYCAQMSFFVFLSKHS